jgi:hypothetical protein
MKKGLVENGIEISYESIYVEKGIDNFSNRIPSKLASKIYINSVGNKFIDICCRGKLDELFDLDTLATDYSKFVPYIVGEILSYKNVQLESFLGDKWDDQGWLTGLILGYPIENTISRIYL